MKEQMSEIAVKPLQVFVVENHSDTLQTFKFYLEDSGHQVHSAMTVDEAHRVIPKLEVDVLICDIGLPDGTGWELMKNLPKNIYAVAMSGFGMNADAVKSKAAGFRHHLLKPFKAAELDRILAEAATELSARRGDASA